MASDRDILVEAFGPALAAWRARRDLTLMSAFLPKGGDIAPVVQAIEQTKAYQDVQGCSLFTGNSGVVIAAEVLAPMMFDGAGWAQDSEPEEAVDWLLKILTTPEAPGSYITAIWGLSIDEPADIPHGWRLVPYDQVPKSYLKETLEERGRRWVSLGPSAGPPTAAVIRRIESFPYLATTDSVSILEEHDKEVLGPVTVVQGKIVGKPLKIGSWFSYDDRSLDIREHEDYVTWLGHEISPYVDSVEKVTANRVRWVFEAESCMLPTWSQVLNRSMRRFIASQCRHHDVDRILDLAIAFEIALSTKGDKESQAPLRWKLGVRAALLVGNTSVERKDIRKRTTEFYDQRSKAAHGGETSAREAAALKVIIAEATGLFRRVLDKLWARNEPPDWNAIELGDGVAPPSRQS